MPAISVIVPVYKVEPYLHRCVNSILAQTFTDFELILVDDGSPDNCGAICDEYAKENARIHVIHQPNGGPSAARNAGIDWAFANSDSQWLAFVDSDDWVHPQYLELLYEAARENDVKISMCELQEVQNNNTVPPAIKTADLLDWDFMLINHNWHAVVPWNKLYYKDLFLTLRYPVGKIHEDEFLTYKLLFLANKIAYVATELYYYFRNQNGIMGQSFSLKRLDSLEALKERAAFSKLNGSKQLFKFDLLHLIKNCEDISYKINSSATEEAIMYTEVVRRLRKDARIILMSHVFLFPPSKEYRHCYYFAFPLFQKAITIVKRLLGKG